MDFGVSVEPADLSKYDFIKLPVMDTWDILMRRDSPLADKQAIRSDDLPGCRCFVPGSPWCETAFPDGWKTVLPG